MSNGLYNGLENGLHNGVYNGLLDGSKSSVFENETVVRHKLATVGLVLNVDSNNIISYNNGSSRVYDLTLKRNNGTLTNGVSVTNRNVFSFDGINDYIDFGNDSSLDFGSGNFTASILFRYTNAGSRCTIMNKFYYLGGGNENGFYIDILGTGIIRAAIETDGSNYSVVDSKTFVDNPKVYYVTLLRRNNKARIYINGVFENENTLSIGTVGTINTTQNFTIGRRGDLLAPLFTNYFSGYVKSCQIYNRALSNEEILNNYLAVKCVF